MGDLPGAIAEYEKARQLSDDPFMATLCAAANPPPDAHSALQRAQAAGVSIRVGATASQAALDANDLAIDALLGIGASRAPDGAIAAAIRALNASPCQGGVGMAHVGIRRLTSFAILGILMLAATPARATLSGASDSNFAGFTCSGGASADGDCQRSASFTNNTATTFTSPRCRSFTARA